MFELLENIHHRPRPFEFYTAEELWTDPHTSAQMLANHLDAEVDRSSRKAAFIERSVGWIESRFKVQANTRIADFGCGPGLYTNRLAKLGAKVTGIDFSARSLAHARGEAEKAHLPVSYIHQNYLDFESPEGFDLIMMIMCDFCVLSPPQRMDMLRKFHEMLLPGGSVLLDVYSLHAFQQRREENICEAMLLDGFWSDRKYYGFLNIFKYGDAKVVLDKYTIVEKERTRTFYNWLQYFSPDSLRKEFLEAGFTDLTLKGNVAGAPFDESGSEFAMVATREP